MAYAVGIDIGTSFVAAAITRLVGAGHEAPQQLHLGARSTAAPSAIYLGEDGQLLVGEAAERRGLTDPHRVVREFKRRVGDPVPLVVGDLLVAPQDVFATLARWVVDRATEQEGEPPERVVVAQPAGWGGYKTGLLREALAGVGLGDAALISEPEAAALHYASFERVDVGSTIAVYDLGGGTLDVAVLRKVAADTFDVLGTPEGLERLGGADFDEAVFRHVTTSLDGDLAGLDTADPTVLLAYSRLRRECTEAKEALSGDSETTVPVLLPGVHTQVRLVRAEFEGLIEDRVRETVETLRHALGVAEVDPGELSAVLLVGGSSRVPLVAELVSAELGRPVAVDADPKASICLGAALAAAFPGAAEGTTVVVGDGAAVPGVAVLDGAALADAATVPDHDRSVGAGAPGAARAADDVPTLPIDVRLPAPVAAVAGGSWLVGARRGGKVAAVLAGVVGITMLTAVAGQTPEVVQNLLPPTLTDAQAGTSTGTTTGGTPGSSSAGTRESSTPGKGAAGETSGEPRPSARSATPRATPAATAAPTPGSPSPTTAQPSSGTPATSPSAPSPAGTGTPSTTGTGTPGPTGSPTTPATQAPSPSTSPTPSPSPTPAPATQPPTGGTTGQEDPTTPSPGPSEPTSPAESPSVVQGEAQFVETPAGAPGIGGTGG